MGVLIPFHAAHPDSMPQDTEEMQILSTRHKTELKNRLHSLTKLVTDKDLGLIRSETIKKAEGITSSKEFVTKLVLRVKLLYQMLFDSEFPKSRTTSKTLTAGLLYFVNSGDFLADNIPGLGFLDDAYIIRETWRKSRKEITEYMSIKGIDENLYI